MQRGAPHLPRHQVVSGQALRRDVLAEALLPPQRQLRRQLLLG
mgnify:CR=1 FL=1